MRKEVGGWRLLKASGLSPDALHVCDVCVFALWWSSNGSSGSSTVHNPVYYRVVTMATSPSLVHHIVIEALSCGILTCTQLRSRGLDFLF